MNALWKKGIEMRLAIFWFCLFSVNSLLTCFVAAFTGPNWNTMSNQQLCLTYAMIVVNWTGTIMAFVKQTGKKIESHQPLFDDTGYLRKSDVQEKVAEMPSKKGQPPSQ